MSETSTLIGYGGRTIGREELTLVPTPAATETHRPIPHHEIVGALVETLGFRHIGVVHDEYAVSPDGMKVFGVLDLATEMEGCRFSIGLRNSHDKGMRLAMTCGYRVFVCSNMAFAGDFTPVLAKHSRSFSLIDRGVSARTIWGLSNALPSAFKELDPILPFKATAKLGEFLEAPF